MAGEWLDTTIGGQATLQRGIDITKAEQRFGVVPVISSGGVSSYHDTPAAVGPGVVLGRKGVVGSVYFVASDYWPHDTTLWVKDFHGNEPRYVYYFFRWMAPRIATMDVGSANPTLNRNHVHPIEVSWPPLEEQRAIAHILGTLDDKIELNRRMNETLEAMARALFKSWFVDFDPVRAKAAGRDPGLANGLADLFPDSFQDTELGEIPEGWRCSNLREVTSKIGSGATPRGGGSVYVADGVALVRSQNVYDSLFVWDGLARITDAAAAALSGVSVEHEDVLLNITGASILRTCVVDPEVLPARVNQHVCIVRPKPEMPSRYIHLHLLQPSTKAFLMGMDAGASRQAVTKGHIESVPLVLPPKTVLDAFARLVGPMFRATSHSMSQSRSLASARDALLPKLISGDIRVADAERIAGSAT